MRESKKEKSPSGEKKDTDLKRRRKIMETRDITATNKIHIT